MQVSLMEDKELRYRAAMVQMLVEGGSPEQNLERAARRIEEAAGAGARLVVLPEACDLGWTHPSAHRLAQPIPEGTSFRRIADAARANGVYVCAGLVERDGDAVFNTAVLVSPSGELLLRHRKINELEIAWEFYGPGEGIGVCRTEIGVVGLLVCADGFAKEHFVGRALGYLGAEIILAPSSWAVSSRHDQAAEPYGALWRKSFSPVAEEFGSWVIAVSNVGPLTEGPWAGKKCIGCSLAFDPEGKEVVSGSYGEAAEEILYLEPTIRQKPRVFYADR